MWQVSNFQKKKNFEATLRKKIGPGEDAMKIVLDKSHF